MYMVHSTQDTAALNKDDSFLSAEARWEAVIDRNQAADGHFYFSVLTTGVFCKPSCGARLPNRENVDFHDTTEKAIKAGFRPCKRCKPTSGSLDQRQTELVEKVCRFIERSEEEPSLATLAEHAELSPHYFNRIFKKVTGVTPKQYMIGRRSEAVRKGLTEGSSVTEAIYSAGFNTASRFYDGSKPRLGMSAVSFKKGGEGTEIRYTIKECWLGLILVAATGKGVCSILFGDSAGALSKDLKQRFPKAIIEQSEKNSDFEAWITKTLSYVERPSLGLNLPLDIHGTAFQERVWRALQSIPPGQTASYAEIAQKIGKPTASRAVAAACAANPVATVIPCHRVVKSNGELSGYRWGKARKRLLLEREATS